MHSFATIFGLAALAGSVLAAPVSIAERDAPNDWAYGYLESYPTYHLRYIALSCEDQHNTTFFDDCCHPLLSTQNLTSRPDYCTPNATEIASAASVISATSTTLGTSATSVAAEVASEYQAAATTTAVVASTTAPAADFATAKAAEPTTTSTSVYVAPTTKTTTKAAATTTAASSGSGQTMTGGYATFFYQGGNAGECGTVHSDSEYGIAIDANGWWSNYQSSSSSPYCGKQITITNSNNGKSVTATVWDVCPTCVSNNSLDLSVAAFNAIASEGDGMVPITWQWA